MPYIIQSADGQREHGKLYYHSLEAAKDELAFLVSDPQAVWRGKPTLELRAKGREAWSCDGVFRPELRWKIVVRRSA